jgi:hypothetical protein
MCCTCHFHVNVTAALSAYRVLVSGEVQPLLSIGKESRSVATGDVPQLTQQLRCCPHSSEPISRACSLLLTLSAAAAATAVALLLSNAATQQERKTRVERQTSKRSPAGERIAVAFDMRAFYFLRALELELSICGSSV